MLERSQLAPRYLKFADRVVSASPRLLWYGSRSESASPEAVSHA